MNPVVVGINHETTELSVRERAALDEKAGTELAESLISGEGFAGVVVLSTCNRTELWLESRKRPEHRVLRELFGRSVNLPPSEAAKGYVKTGEEAVHHLFSVASGLNSQVVGEREILGQVRRAYRSARDCGSISPLLGRLFQRAVECGRYVRSRTGISDGAESVAGMVVSLVSRTYEQLAGKNVLVVGAGEAATTAAERVREAGARRFRISNRGAERALKLARRLKGERAPFPPDPESLAWADVVVSATGDEGYVVTADALKRARRGKGMTCLIDLAVPRDIEPSARSEPGFYLYDLESLEELVEENLRFRAKEAERALKIVTPRAAEFIKWARANGRAQITMLKETFERVRAEELESHRAGSDEEQRRMEKLARSLTGKLLKSAIEQLKEGSE